MAFVRVWIHAVRAYINQKEHHKKITFTDEYEKFIRAYKFNSQG